MQLVVIVATTVLTAEHSVGLIQLHKAAMQGWVSRVSVRVQLG